MSETKSSYLQIFKTTSLFGGVQLFTIIISIIRTKCIALFIGPAGMGIVTLLNSSLNIIGGITGLGIETSAVKHISASYKKDDLDTVSIHVSIIKKIALLTAILASLLTIFFSNVLSTLTFGNSSHTLTFVFISVTLLFKQLSNAELSILQGLRKFRYLAKANFYGNLFGLLFSIPLYYFYKIDAIAPTIIIASLFSFLFSFYFVYKLRIKKNTVTKAHFLNEGKSIVKLGAMLSLSGVFSLISIYLVQLYISKYGGLDEVGLFNAGFTLLNSYVGIIFTAMSTDYFPRLSAICEDKEKVRTSVYDQAFISILLITPIILIFIPFAPLIINILFTAKFSSIIPMVTIGILGMLFRAVSWSMGFILLAKGDSQMFIKTALAFNILSLILNIAGYYYYGLIGLGYSFCIYYLIHFFAMKIITKKRYGFYFENDFYKIYCICIFMCILTYLFTFITYPVLKYSLMAALFLLSIGFVIYHINQKIALKEIFNSILKRKK